MLIDGRKIANRIIRRLKNKPPQKKSLVAVLIGNNKASVSFLRQKERVAEILGIAFDVLKLRSSVSFQKLKYEIGKLNRDKTVGGIIIQLPLPGKFNLVRVVDLLNPKKDVDALGKKAKVLPSTVGAVEKIFKNIKFNPRSKNAVVVGRGFLVGEPITKWLKPRVKKLTITDKGMLDKKALSQADLIITGAGKANLIKGDFIKQGIAMIDFGVSPAGRGNTQTKRGLTRKFTGDIDFDSCKKKAKHITPTPGGTGPIVVAQVFENFYLLLGGYKT